MAVRKMSFEGEIYYGVKGSTASTKLTNVRDVNLGIEHEEGDTSERGSGANPPIKYSRVTGRMVSVDWQMLEKSDDTSLSALKTAAAAGTPVAIKLVDYASGTTRFDGDMIVSYKKSEPHGKEMAYTFTGKPNNDDRDATIA